MKREPLIQRYEHNHFRGWVFATKRRGRRWVKYFSDRPDGRARALQRAREYRDRVVARLPRPTKIKQTYRLNLTGVVGVARTKERTRRGSILARYVASWPLDGGGSGKASFSVALYGESDAKRRAIQARQSGVAAFMSVGAPTRAREAASRPTGG